jgi:hypothetical protein
MLRDTRKFLFVFVCSLVCITPVYGWEVEAPVPLPFPVGTIPKNIYSTPVAINIDESTTKLSYVLTNRNQQSQQNTFAIHLPLFAWDGVAAEYADRHFPELRVSTGGKAIAIKSHKIALHNGIDITSELLRAKLDPVRVGALGEESLLDCQQGTKSVYRKLIMKGVLQPAAGCLIPKWYVQVSYSWKQFYKPLSNTEFEIRYMARPGYFPITRNDPMLASYLTAHCGTIETLDKLLPKTTNEDEYLRLHFYKIPFGLAGLSNDEAILNFSPDMKTKPIPEVSFVCTGSSNARLAIGSPALKNQKVRSGEKVVSILVVARQ